MDLVLVHCTDGIAIADYLAKFPYPVIVGPGMTPRSKHETWNKTYETAGVLSRAGLKVCITADHDVTPCTICRSTPHCLCGTAWMSWRG